ncbi:MAG: hypothetical protein ACHQAX_09935 [Gammaproteobacteria bacterium]
MFTCPNLQAALERTKPSFDSGSDYMNTISNDIRNLEKFLADYPIPCSITIDIENCVLSYQQAIEFPWFGKLDPLLDGDLFIILEKLAWDNEKKRLSHIVCVSKSNSRDEYFDGSKRHYLPLFPHVEVSNKPLMESKFVIKKKAHQFLPNMIEDIAKEFGYIEKDYSFDFEMPF